MINFPFELEAPVKGDIAVVGVDPLTLMRRRSYTASQALCLHHYTKCLRPTLNTTDYVLYIYVFNAPSF